MRPGFWSPEARSYLLSCGRQDLIDRGDVLAQRVTALIMTAQERLNHYIMNGDLYNNKGGLDDLRTTNPIMELEDFVNNRLRNEINALELLLQTFTDFSENE